MSRITILGGTGYTGTNIAREAAGRGHQVTSFSRNQPSEPLDGVSYLTGSIADATDLEKAIEGADVVVATAAPRGELEATLRGLYADLAQRTADAGARLGVVGGFSALRPAPGAPRIADSGEVPAEYLAEAQAMAHVIDDLVASAPAGLDWFYVSPAAGYGSYSPGEAKGTYRTGGDVAVFDESGASDISGADFAKAIVDEIETPKYSRQQFGVAY